jgi:hypothetical protein
MGAKKLSKNNGFTPPAHPNAEVHKKIMARLRAMSSREVVQTLVDAGVLTKSLKIAKPYRAEQ